jgi:F-type H+-transporting ATPase subunit b
VFNIDFTFAFTAINLAVMYYFVNRFLFKRLAKNMDERSASIREGLARGEENKKEADRFEREKADWRKEVLSQQKELLDSSKAAAVREADRIIGDARDEAARVKNDAQTYIARERENMRQEVAGEMVSLALAAASEVISANVDDDRNRALTERFLSEREGD